MSEIRAVIYDRDGVLTDFDMAAAASYFRGLLPITLEEMWLRWEAWGAKTGYPRNLEEEQRFFSGYWDSLADECRLSDSVRRQLHMYDYIECLVPYSDAQPSMVWAKKSGLKVGVLSNFALASLTPSLAATGLIEYVDAACAATVIGVSKPERRAYEIAAESLGVTVEECVFFDDEAPCVIGARQAGMRAYLVDRSRHTLDLDNCVVSDLSAIECIADASLVAA